MKDTSINSIWIMIPIVVGKCSIIELFNRVFKGKSTITMSYFDTQIGMIPIFATKFSIAINSLRHISKYYAELCYQNWYDCVTNKELFPYQFDSFRGVQDLA